MVTPVNSSPGFSAVEAASGEHLVEHETQGTEFGPVIDRLPGACFGVLFPTAPVLK
jgi:hypothetical protein